MAARRRKVGLSQTPENLLLLLRHGIGVLATILSHGAVIPPLEVGRMAIEMTGKGVMVARSEQAEGRKEMMVNLKKRRLEMVKIGRRGNL